MALYKILTYNAKNTYTFSGIVKDAAQNTLTGVISGVISGEISGEVSGYIYGVNYVANNLQHYSGVASGIISGIVKGTISDVISGVITEEFPNNYSGIITSTYKVPGLSFLRDDIEEEFDWTTNSLGVLKEKLISLYNVYPMCRFIPVHILDEELNLNFDGCISG
jgi:hypothetical protein